MKLGEAMVQPTAGAKWYAPAVGRIGDLDRV